MIGQWGMGNIGAEAGETQKKAGENSFVPHLSWFSFHSISSFFKYQVYANKILAFCLSISLFFFTSGPGKKEMGCK
jgi:hypothetical protein